MPASELNEKQLMIITVAIAGVLVVLLGVGLYIGYNQYSDVKVKREEQERERTRLAGIRTGLPALELRLEMKTKKAEKVFDLLPNKADISGLMQEITDKGRRTGLQIIEAKIVKIRGETDEAYKQIAYDWKWKGSFHEIAKFVNQVEDDMDRFLKISEMSIEAKEKGMLPGVKGDKGHLVTLRMVTYQYIKTQAPQQ